MTTNLFPPRYSNEVLNNFTSGHEAVDFFDFVSNFVSLEACISVVGILYPAFSEEKHCVYWYSKTDKGRLLYEGKFPTGYDSPKEVERYRNNFNLSEFFRCWEKPSEKYTKKAIEDADAELLAFFAEQLSQAWLARLKELFPDREFEFEIGMDILDEAGFCMTFSQKK